MFPATLSEQPIKDAVITVPAYFNQAERRAVLHAARMADLKVLQLINDNTAVALNYGVFRRKDINATAQVGAGGRCRESRAGACMGGESVAGKIKRCNCEEVASASQPVSSVFLWSSTRGRDETTLCEYVVKCESCWSEGRWLGVPVS